MTSPDTTHTTARFALALVCAHDGVRHLVADDQATTALVHGGQTTALCGHQVLPSPLGMPAREKCPLCPHAADLAGLPTP